MDGETSDVTLLLVEDSAADVYLVREALEAEGLHFLLKVAEDGEIASRILERVEAEIDPPPQLALLDLNLPRKNGIQVLEQMRRSPRCGRIPVIVISSSNSPQDRQRALEAGAAEYFHKSSELDEFMRLGRLVRTLSGSVSTGGFS